MNILESTEYNFLLNDFFQRHKIILLAYGGSHAYGLNTPTSDIDVRGIAMNTESEMLGLDNFEQYIDNTTDTVVYAFNKVIKLLLNCNPNIIEMLGYRNYLILTDIGQKLLDNKKLFLSKKAIASFGGYANQQEHRLLNKIISGRDDLHINKQAMHLIRLYMTCIDILEKEDVIIYRSDKEREFLMSIRNGMYLNKDGTYKQEFFDVLSEYKEKFKYAKNNTSLPDCANIELINQFMIDCNRSILL